MKELQQKYVNKTIFEVVSNGSKMDIQRAVRRIEENCELLFDDPVELSGKRRYTFSTSEGEEVAEMILRSLLKIESFRIAEFQISRPDLETIFLRATKKNWEEKDYLGRKENPSLPPHPAINYEK